MIQKNDKNQPPPQSKPMVKSQLIREEMPPPRQEEFDFKFNIRANT